jgi:hypothetical protein
MSRMRRENCKPASDRQRNTRITAPNRPTRPPPRRSEAGLISYFDLKNGSSRFIAVGGVAFRGGVVCGFGPGHAARLPILTSAKRVTSPSRNLGSTAAAAALRRAMSNALSVRSTAVTSRPCVCQRGQFGRGQGPFPHHGESQPVHEPIRRLIPAQCGMPFGGTVMRAFPSIPKIS